VTREFVIQDVSPQTLDGRYRLVRPIARVTSGGYVHAAEHVFTHKPCAVKSLDAGSSEKVRKRMLREMEALAAVQGPGVVDFRDAGEADGRAYLVLELLEGRTLAGLLAAKGTLAVDQAMQVGAAIADVLARCHERGVIHRDIKPANVFVTTNEEVQLLDFGIAKIVDREQKLEKLTQENTLLGTPEYMAPEALLLSPDVDEQADQYSLGVTLYEALVGVVPFEGTYGEVLQAAMSKPLPSLRLARPDVPGIVEDIIVRALRREAADRFSSIAEMGAALRGAVRNVAGARVFDHRPAHGGRDTATLADAPIAKMRAGATRRRHARAPYLTLARIRPEGAEAVDGRIEEISESGVQFVGAAAMPEGTRVVLRFALPISGRIVETGATSRWARSTRTLTAMGFELAELGDDAVSEIRRYVALMCTD
jgi:hypothetical protein